MIPAPLREPNFHHFELIYSSFITLTTLYLFILKKVIFCDNLQPILKAIDYIQFCNQIVRVDIHNFYELIDCFVSNLYLKVYLNVKFLDSSFSFEIWTKFCKKILALFGNIQIQKQCCNAEIKFHLINDGIRSALNSE